MKTLLLTIAAVLALAGSAAHADMNVCPAGAACQFTTPTPAPAPVPVPAPLPTPAPAPTVQPLGWVWAPYLSCNPNGCVVQLAADGVNVRLYPNGPVTGSLANGVPLHVVGQEGKWVQVVADCTLLPTGVWSDTAGVPLYQCQEWGH